jgi:DNA-directed RNA polymerase specialized sigma subunit
VSKARVIITAVVVEGRSQAQVARDYHVSQGYVSRHHMERTTVERTTGFEPATLTLAT